MEKVILYPTAGMGHIIAMVELGKLILTHPSNSISSVTILVPTHPVKFSCNDSISSYIASVSSAFPSITFHSLPFVPLSRGEPSNYPDNEAITYESLRNNNPYVLNALQTLSSSYTISAFIVDFFCYSSLEVSRPLNIPTYFFMASGACVLSLFLNYPVFDRILGPDSSYRNLRRSFEIPGLFNVPASHMNDSMLDRGVSYDEFVKMGDHLSKADGIIINTFEALEARTISSLEQGTCTHGIRVPPIFCIGPLIAQCGEKKEGDLKGNDRCLSWLDSQPKRSVVYLSFGSMGLMSKEQIWEVALGLERSRVRFLWVVRAPPSGDKKTKFEPPSEPDLDSILPKGFLERTKDRGLVVKLWAPQVAVLAHDSVGGFVTHCGWNSTLEAVCAGVPIVAWPLYAEQRFNKIVLLQDTGIALPMNESEDRFVCSDEIEMRVKQILNSEEGDIVRKRMLELQVEAKVALDEGGSSRIAFSKLVGSWKQ